MERKTWWWRRAFVYVGRVSANKGVPQIIEAWSGLAEAMECPPLWLVGGEPLEIQAMREHVGTHRLSNLEVAGKLAWWGYLDSAGISAVLTRAIALVTHSRYEPGGRVILEAMSEGVPVIATPHGFGNDLVRDWHSGFLVPFNDVDRLRRCMAYFLNQPLLRSVLGESARSEATQALDDWSFNKTHFKVYDSVASKGRPPFRVNPPVRATPRPKLSRRLPPQYPFLENEPTDEMVQRFFHRAMGTETRACCKLAELADSSVLWCLEGEGRKWLVKWPQSRIETRPLWDPLRKRPLFRSGRERFRTELLASDLPGFAATQEADETHCLLLRPWLPVLCQEADDEALHMIGTLYQKLYSHKPEVLWLEDLDRNWNEASRDEIQAARLHYEMETLACPEPWDTSRHFSSRLVRRNLELILRSPKRLHLLEEPIVAEARDSLRALVEVTAAEHFLPVVVCHGSAGWRHVALAPSGDPVLLDGEHVHPGWAGEDLAALLLDAMPANVPSEVASERLESSLNLMIQDPIQRVVTSAWLGLLAIEDLIRVCEMDLQNDLPETLRRWKAVRQHLIRLTL